MKKMIMSLMKCACVVSSLMFIMQGVEAEEIQLEKIVIESSRLNDDWDVMNKSVEVITQKDIAMYPAHSLPELLGMKSGLMTTQYGHLKNAQVDMRGYGENAMSNVLVLINGRRTNQIDLSGQDWAQIDIHQIERIEIIKGSGSVLYGDNAMAGVINIITKEPGISKPKLTLSSQYGSYQTSAQAMSLTGGSEKVSFVSQWGHKQTSGYRAQSEFSGQDINHQLKITPNEWVSVNFAQGYHGDKYQLPGALFASDIAQYGRRGVRPSLANDHGDTKDMHYDVEPVVKWDIGATQSELSMLTTYRQRDNRFRTGSSVYETYYKTDTYEWQPKWLLRSQIDELTNKFTVGYDMFHAKNRRRSGYLSSTPDVVFISKTMRDIYLLDEFTLSEQWMMNAGARRAMADYVFDQQQVVRSKSSRTPHAQAYEVGVGYKYQERSKIYSQYQHGYRFPAVDEFYQNLYDFGGGVTGGGLNTELSYQKSDSIELGVKDRSIDWLDWDASTYLTRVRREIYLDPFSFVNTNYPGESWHYGLEGDALLHLPHQAWDIFSHMTLQRAQFGEGPYQGQDIPFVPRWAVLSGLHLRPLKGLTLTGQSQLIAQRYAISDVRNNQDRLKSVATCDLLAQYQIKDWTWWFGIRNLLDKKYHAYAVYSSFSSAVGYYPAETRHVDAGFTVTF